VILELAAGATHAMVVVAVISMANRLVPERVWSGGVVKRGSIVETADGVRFSIHNQWGPATVVTYDGPLPDTVCDNADVALEGWVVGDHFEAMQVIGYNNGRYDPCWEWQCRPDARPLQCRRELKYE
jgi:cytochrome c-type biogenesis protein CcmE